MKYILIILIVIGCKSKHSEVQKPKNNSKQDTVIHQKVEFNGLYILYTYIQTDSVQCAFYNKNTQFHLYNSMGVEITSQYYPYSNIIKGSFNYIEENKKVEYEKALRYFPDLIKRNNDYNDSVKYLNDLN